MAELSHTKARSGRVAGGHGGNTQGRHGRADSADLKTRKGLMSQVPTIDAIRDAYRFTGLEPLACGPELYRTSAGRIGGGPFVALYLHAVGVKTSSLNDDDLAHVAELAEAWSLERYGREIVAGLTAGFDCQGILSFGGCLQCTPLEERACFYGEVARRLLGAKFHVYHAQPAGVES